MGILSVPHERHRLPNGLRVVLSHDPSVPVVAVNLWYGVGSRNEPEGRTGFAHLFEHMMFQGSANVPKNRHFELIERAGGALNATTWYDRTNYFETVPSHHLDLALWLESDRMGWMLPALDQEKLDNQRDVVKNEKRQRYDNQPYGDWDERLQRLVFPPAHPYHHTVIGSMEDLDGATLEDVAAFFRTYYVPRNAVLTVAGDFDPAAVMDRVAAWFGEIPSGGAIPPLPGSPEVEPLIGSTVRDDVVADVPLPRGIMAFRIPPYASGDFPVAEVARAVLGTGRASRLYRRLVRE
ncbi:MAG: insulinase family protein, partial [Gemmatimonadetes bacterium]|nr:insulinase family protein [Gemmatimonadota bacterium]